MKKIVMVAAAAMLFGAASFAQVMGKAGVKNTLSTSFGKTAVYTDSKTFTDEDVRFYGFIDTVQTRIDISKFTVEGMLNWGALNWNSTTNSFSDDFQFVNTKITPFWYTNSSSISSSNNESWWTNADAESYYVNFIFHPHKYWDLGMGTRLEWKVGPAPAYNGNLWEPYAHIVQGGLKDARPGAADVVGYTYYANNYTAWYDGQTKSALAARFHYKDFIEVGAALPSGVTTDKPLFNAGLRLHPIQMLTVSAAVDSVFRNSRNFYTGLTLAFKPFILDAYLGLNYRGKDYNYFTANPKKADRWGTGAALTFNFAKIGLMLKPEAGFTFYNESDYTAATYGGIRINWNINEKFMLGGFSSLAWGSEDKAWKDNAETKDYWGGFIFDIRPDFTWKLDKQNAFTAYFDFQHKENYAKNTSNCWATGVYWTFNSK